MWTEYVLKSQGVTVVDTVLSRQQELSAVIEERASVKRETHSTN